MRTVTFKSVLWGVARLLGLDPERDLNTVRAGTLTEYINARVREAVQFDFWPELCAIEERHFRPEYDATENISAAAERWHSGSQLYYQALVAQSPAAQAPASYSAGTWTENSAYWAQCRASYADASDWLTGTVYAVGDQVRNPLTNLFYQVHTAHTAGATIDLTKMGALTAFARTIDFAQTGETAIGEVPQDGVTERDPRVYPVYLGRLPFRIVAEGVLVGGSVNTVWLHFRRRPPEFNSTAYSATANVTAGDIRYYATTGECYTALQSQSPAAQAPTATAYWTKLDFPAWLAGFVKLAAASDALGDQKQTARKTQLLNQAREELSDTRDRDILSQGQNDTVAVATYGS